MKRRTAVYAVMMFSLLGAPAFAEEEYRFVIKEHRFEPAELVVPAHKKIRIVVENQDPTAEEFESYELNREKIIGPNSRASVIVGPLKPGSYKVFGEFNQATCQGAVVARE